MQPSPVRWLPSSQTSPGIGDAVAAHLGDARAVLTLATHMIDRARAAGGDARAGLQLGRADAAIGDARVVLRTGEIAARDQRLLSAPGDQDQEGDPGTPTILSVTYAARVAEVTLDGTFERITFRGDE